MELVCQSGVIAVDNRYGGGRLVVHTLVCLTSENTVRTMKYSLYQQVMRT